MPKKLPPPPPASPNQTAIKRKMAPNLRDGETTIKIKFSLSEGGGLGGKRGKPWRVPNPPGANPLVAERAFSTSDYWGRTGVARCAEEMRQESVGISNRLLTPCHTRLRRPPRILSATRVSTRGVRHSPEIVQNAVFRGKRHDNKILKVQILLSRNFVVIAQAPKFERKTEPKLTMAIPKKQETPHP